MWRGRSDAQHSVSHLLLSQIHFASVAAAHAQFGDSQVGPQTRLKPRRPVIHVLHVHRDGGHRREEGLVGGGAVEGVLEHMTYSFSHSTFIYTRERSLSGETHSQ